MLVSEVLKGRKSIYSESSFWLKLADWVIAISLALVGKLELLALNMLVELIKASLAAGVKRALLYAGLPVALSSIMLVVTYMYFGIVRMAEVAFRISAISLSTMAFVVSISPLEVSAGLSRIGLSSIGEALELALRNLAPTFRDAEDVIASLKLAGKWKGLRGPSRAATALVASALIRSEMLREYYWSRFYGLGVRKKYPLRQGKFSAIFILAKLFLAYIFLSPSSIVLM